MFKNVSCNTRIIRGFFNRVAVAKFQSVLRSFVQRSFSLWVHGAENNSRGARKIMMLMCFLKFAFEDLC